MRSARFPLIGLVAAALAGCAPAPAVEQAASPALGGPLPGQWEAFYAVWPDRLLAGARAACRGPGSTLEAPDRGTVTCRSLPPPDLAASLILTFGGTVEALPEHVITFRAEPQGQGYRVTIDSVVIVPRPAGPPVEVRFDMSEFDRAVAAAVDATGGLPL